jgi:hypothetical protein
VQARDIGTLTTPGGAWLPYMVLEWLDGKTLEAFLGHDDGVGRSGAARGARGVSDHGRRGAGAGAGARAGGRAPRHQAGQLLRARAGAGARGGDQGAGLRHRQGDAAQSQAAQKATGTQISSFTPSYGAPEQFDRTFGATGPWTDVFQMALVILEVMRGGLPALGGRAFMQLAFASQNPDRRPTPRLYGIEVSDEVEAVFGGRSR